MHAQMNLSIGSVERETGLSKDTLRVWERRYGFPQPLRDAGGERVYSLEDVEKLRLLKRLLDRGYRPGKIIAYGAEELKSLASGLAGGTPQGAEPEPVREDLQSYIAYCKAYQFDQMRRALGQALLRDGLFRFVVETVAPLTTMVGNLWENGDMAVFEEHLYTESIQIVMRNAIASIPLHAEIAAFPRVLLTTFPQESHSLGLLMAEAIFAIEGARCISLGTQTPITDIALAAEAQSADIVALSFSSAFGANHALEGLQDLRARLPASIEIWAGGRCPVLLRRPPSYLRILDLQDIQAALMSWRRGRTG